MAGMNGVVLVGSSEAGRRIREAGLRFEESHRPQRFLAPSCPDARGVDIAALKPRPSDFDPPRTSEVDTRLIRALAAFYETPRTPTEGDAIGAIIAATAVHFDTSPAKIIGSTSSRRTAHVRHIAVWLCREILGASSTRIGKIIGRDHTTVIHAWRAVPARLRADRVLASFVAELRAKLEAVLP